MKPTPARALELALSSVPEGAAAVQLRERDLNPRELLALGKELRPVCRARKTPLLINDRLDVALALGAEGVHLREASFSAADVRAFSPKLLLGVSCHSRESVERARGADFVTLGPLFDTPSKRKFGQPLGLDGFAKALVPGGPAAFALGGINLLTGKLALQSGAHGLAAVRAIWDGEPASQAARLWAILSS
ncbi:MAG: thiamine phosphate synthase [Deltaproteobacteria bacterium]|nr:thiamine phosphate synthase [Deltaproteobacteria bacterium]